MDDTRQAELDALRHLHRQLLTLIQAIQDRGLRGVMNVCSPEPWSRFQIGSTLAGSLDVDPRLVQGRLSREACAVELRLAVLAPGFADPAAVQDRLGRLPSRLPDYSP